MSYVVKIDFEQEQGVETTEFGDAEPHFQPGRIETLAHIHLRTKSRDVAAQMVEQIGSALRFGDWLDTEET